MMPPRTLVNPPAFDEVQAALARAEARTGAAESHGMLCAMICARAADEAQLWLAQTLGTRDADDAIAGECRQLLLAARDATRSQLESLEFDFRLLLPADETPLAGRSDALALWCRGFLMGLSLVGVEDVTALPADTREIVGDLSEFTKMTSQPDETEEEEAAYAELVEYVRAGVMLMNEELSGGRSRPLH